jgi:hypothetical protein
MSGQQPDENIEEVREEVDEQLDKGIAVAPDALDNAQPDEEE